ncbi:MAG: glycosyltransferase family 39 protein [Deltaproteobacteria bacterium]|nr:glycosyltransferase family 39 protein [Deltaproteobacteria bacterium]
MASWLVPITTDEAYYAIWGQFLDWGYFDHPPGVALLTSLSQINGDIFLNARAGVLLLSLVSLLLASRFFGILKLNIAQWVLALLIFKFNIAGLIGGTLATPDALVITFWLLALHECYVALTIARYRWLTAGLVTGLGLLSKYTVVLLGPIFAIMLWKKDREAFKTPWPYAGALVCLLVFSPNLYWNAQNHWQTFRFQMGRLTASELPHYNSKLPLPQTAEEGSPEDLLAKALQDEVKKQDVGEKEKEPDLPSVLNKWRTFSNLGIFKIVQRLSEFILGQGAMLGFLLIPLLLGLFRRKKKSTPPPSLALTLLRTACWVPLVFFALVSLFIRVEPNWSAMYILSAAPLLAFYYEHFKKTIYYALLANLVLFLVMIVHAHQPFLSLANDRILKESSGYTKLAEWSRKEHVPLYADSYQITSMVRVYNPFSNIHQWPGITRPSEFTFNMSFASSLAQIREAGEFQLISTNEVPPHFASFTPVRMVRLQTCKQGGFLFSSTTGVSSLSDTPCTPVHRWFLTLYRPTT